MSTLMRWIPPREDVTDRLVPPATPAEVIEAVCRLRDADAICLQQHATHVHQLRRAALRVIAFGTVRTLCEPPPSYPELAAAHGMRSHSGPHASALHFETSFPPGSLERDALLSQVVDSVLAQRARGDARTRGAAR